MLVDTLCMSVVRLPRASHISARFTHSDCSDSVPGVCVIV